MKNKFTFNEVINSLKEKIFKRDNYKLLYENFETKISKDGYLQFRVNEKDNWKNVHTLINQYFNLEEYNKKYKELIETGVEKCLVTHHKNLHEIDNKLNNHPDNLQWLGKNEHMIFHTKFIKFVTNKIWNFESPEYVFYENYRKNQQENLKKINNENWYGDNSKNFRKKMKLISAENGKKGFENLWHGDQSKEYREKMNPIQSNNAKNTHDKTWNSEYSEIYRKTMSQNMTKTNVKLWYGKNNKEYRQKMSLTQSKNGKKNIKKLHTNSEIIQKAKEGRIFKIFNKIIENI